MLQSNWIDAKSVREAWRAMNGHVEVVCGAAGSGKTARLRDLFRAELLRLREIAAPGRAVWITPTNRSRRAVLRSLLDKSLPACFAPNVLTFDAFAQQVLRSTASDILPLSAISRRMIVRTVIDEAHGAGSLSYFAPIAETSGFLDLLLAFIAELKRDETWPEEFEAAARRRGSHAKDLELARLYRTYQDRLQDLALYDAEGQFWSARSALKERQHGAFTELSLAIVDGFTDFTQPQYEILAHLAEFADRMIIALPLEDPLHRADLFAKPAAALAQIRHRSAVACQTLPMRSGASAGSAEASFSHVAAHLFDNPREMPRLAQAAGIEIIEAAGPSGEARAIAQHIQKLLIDGVAADQIVVAVRSADEESDVLEETLTAAGIPNWCERSSRLSQTAVAKALVAVLQAEIDDWSFDRLSALLRSNYFRPNWPSVTGTSAIDGTLRALREFKLGSGRRRILDRLAELITTGTAGKFEVPVRMAAAVLQDLSRATERLRQPAEFGDWVDRLIGLGDELGIAAGEADADPSQPGVDGRLDERDRDDWQRLRNVLYDAARTLSLLAESGRSAPERMPLPVFAGRLRDILDSQTFGRKGGETGKVLVLEASEVRNLDVDYLFLAGLSEASFPRGRRDDCFYTEAERRQYLRKQDGPPLASTQQQDEMLLFYSIVTRARRRLTLSYTIVGAAGQPLFPSPFVAALRELFEPRTLDVSTVSDLDPIPHRDRMLTAADLRLVATGEVRRGRPGLFLAMAERPELAPVVRGVLAGAELAMARFETKGFTQFEGMLDPSACSSRLREKFPTEYQFSTTQLESYAGCPFRFFLSDVLKVRPANPADLEIDALERGKWLHEVLRTLHEPPPDEGRPGVPAVGAELAARLRELIAEHFAVDDRTDPFQRSLWAAERVFAERLADLYGSQWEAYQAALGNDWEDRPRPVFVELPFGDLPDSAGPRPAGAPAYVTFGPEGGAVRVRGRIDRIDVGRRDGNPAFTVIDYKSRKGSAFQLDDVRAGVALQLAIYASAILRSGILGAGADVYQMVYWNLTQSGSVSAIKGSSRKKLDRLATTMVEDLERALHEVIPNMVSRLRAGQFPVQNADLDCTGYCPYSTVCRVNQVRSVEQEREKLWDLTDLRSGGE